MSKPRLCVNCRHCGEAPGHDVFADWRKVCEKKRFDKWTNHATGETHGRYRKVVWMREAPWPFYFLSSTCGRRGRWYEPKVDDLKPGGIVPKPELVTVRPRIVCLCGSTRFAEDFNREAERFAFEGAIVVRPEVVTYSSEKDPQRVAPGVKIMLDELHLRKIDLADEVFVINVGGYIGESTSNEIAYAEKIGKPVLYFEPREPTE